MFGMKVCPYYSVGYCKFRDQCIRIHFTEDCENSSCKRKGCLKRHRSQCQFGGSCQRNNKDKTVNSVILVLTQILKG